MLAWHNQRVRTLLVAGAGGHLEELWLLRPRLVGVPGDVTWATPDTAQSRSLLSGEHLVHIPRSDPHDVRATMTTTRLALETLRRGSWSAVVSTGSLPAVPFLAVARTLGIPCHFIESAARVVAPSLSARILDRVPGVHRYGQYRTWTRRRWLFRGSVFDGFSPAPAVERPIRRVVVTVGSSRYGFRRLFEAVHELLPADAEVLWQTGRTDVDGLGIAAAATVPTAELASAMVEADLVVAHAGVGSALMALRAGKCPVLLPRRLREGEHADDHQQEVATVLAAAGLAVAADPGTLTASHLDRAMGCRVVAEAQLAPFVLEPG